MKIGMEMKKIKDFFNMMRVSYAPFIKTAMVLFSLLVVGQLIFLSFPYLQGRIIDNLASKAPFEDSLTIGLIMLALYLANNIAGYARDRYEINNFDMDLSRFINKSTFEKLFRFSLGQHINENSGLRISVVTKGTNALEDTARMFIYSLLPMLLQIFLVAIAITWINPWLGLIVVLMSFLYFWSLFRFNIKFYDKFKKNRDAWNKQSKYYSEIMRNIKLIKTSSKEKSITDEYVNHYDEVASFTKKIWSANVVSYYSRNSMLSFGQVFAVMVGVYMVRVGFNSPGDIVMLIGWMSSIFGNIGNIGWMQRQLIEHISNINKYNEMMLSESAVKELDSPVVLPKISGSVEFKNVTFSYPVIKSIEDDEDEQDSHSEEDMEASGEVLKDVSFKINPGETVAIVGHSGSGKTTIVNLLLRGYDPDTGEILIDGVDLRNLDLSSYIKSVGYVPQNVELFDNTLRYNMAFATEDRDAVTDADLLEVSKKARIDQFYSRLGEKRFDTLVGENGVKLSGGERQRVGIARVLLQKPEILIFDEATSSLDAENEALIHEAMRDALKGKTGIIIAHRLSTIRDADKIIVVDEGKIQGIGKHDELMKTCDIYANLIKRQIMI